MAKKMNAGRQRPALPPRTRRCLRIRQIQDFLAVLASGTLADAARKLSTSQPVLTKSIRTLEHAIGAELFIRSPQGMKPTPFALAFERRARVIAGEIERAHREINELLGAKRGKIVVGAGPAFAKSVLPRAIRRFRHDYPGVDVTLVEGRRRDLEAGVLGGELDYAFHAALDWSPYGDLGFETLLRGVKIHVVGGQDNPLTRRSEVSLRELSAAPWVLHSVHGSLLEKLDAAFAAAGLPPVKPVLECDSMLAATVFIRDSDMVSIFYDYAIKEELAQQTIKVLRVPEISWQSDFGVIYRRPSPIHPAAARLLDAVRQACEEYHGEPARPPAARLAPPAPAHAAGNKERRVRPRR